MLKLVCFFFRGNMKTILILQICFCYFFIGYQCDNHFDKCNATLKSQICHTEEAYLRSEYPEPRPCKVNVTIHLKEIYSIDEDMNTISLFIKLGTQWEDKRISLYRSEKDIERYQLEIFIFPKYVLIKS